MGDSQTIHFYSAYNLEIHSELPLPELLPIHSQDADVIIQWGKLTDTSSKSNGGDYFRGNVDGVGRFLVQHGREIVIDPDPNLDASVLRPILLGPIISVLLRQRGFLVLHASSVAMQGVAVAFMGHSGWGKSTLAEFCHAQGYSLLTDDVMAIQVDSEQPYVIPSFPQIKLCPDAAVSAGHVSGSLPLLNHQSQKLVHRLEHGFWKAPLPLKRIYILTEGTHPQIVPLCPQESFVALIRHSRVVNLLNAPEFVKAHLYQCTHLVDTVQICRLQRQRSLADLPQLVELIATDVAHVQSRCSASEPLQYQYFPSCKNSVDGQVDGEKITQIG